MTRGEKHLHNFLEQLLKTASVLIHLISCVTKFPASVSHDLMLLAPLSYYLHVLDPELTDMFNISICMVDI